MPGSRAWEPWDLQRPWPASQDVHHLCMILITRHEKTPWASTVVAFLSEPPIDIVTVCDEPQGYYMRLWDSGEGVMLREIHLLDAQKEVHVVQVSGSGDAIAIGHGPGHLQVCHYRQGRLETFHKQLGTTGLTQFAFQRDGPMLAAIADDSGVVYIINMFTQVCCQDRQMPAVAPDRFNMTWSPCGRLLVIGASFVLLTIYNDEGAYRYCEYTDGLDWMVALDFSNEGGVLAIGGDEIIKLVKLELSSSHQARQAFDRMHVLHRISLEDDQYADALEWLPHDYAFVALFTQRSFSDDGYQTMTTVENYQCYLQIFELPDGAYWHCVRTVNMQPGLQVHCFAIHKYGHTLDYPYWCLQIVTAAEDGMHFWDMGSGLRLLKQPLHFSETLAKNGSQVLAVLG